jgi:acyl-CoA thioesterase FadM
MPTHKIDAPLALLTDVVHPEWLDYNQHMSEGYYGVAFANATDAFMDFVGLDAVYRARTKGTIYTVEAHLTFLRELKVNDPLRFTTQLLGFDTKRLHVFHHMYHVDEGYLAATMEALLLHVNDKPRVVPMPAEILTNVEATYVAHLSLPAPPQVGQSISMPARKVD